ncbi:MAG: hypothetical protein M3512_14510 [Bacteroidota bacterium]|nr:hypothetical protein [Bacteroidota bacterium]
MDEITSKSLALLDEFLKETSSEDFEKLVMKIDALEIEGPNMDQYLANINEEITLYFESITPCQLELSFQTFSKQEKINFKSFSKLRKGKVNELEFFTVNESNYGLAA